MIFKTSPENGRINPDTIPIRRFLCSLYFSVFITTNENNLTNAIIEKRQHAQNTAIKLIAITFEDEYMILPYTAEKMPKKANHESGKIIPDKEIITISLTELFSILHIEAQRRG